MMFMTSDLAWPVAALVDDGERGVDTLGERAGADHAADVRRDHHGVLRSRAGRLMSRAISGAPNRLSVGMSKKPWIWPAWRSSVSTRSTPAWVMMLETSLAEIGVRPEARRSCRA